MQLWNLFIGMLKAGVLGYGGGPASIPLIQSQVVNTYHFMTAKEFTDALAVAYTLPGPVATKLAAFVGYKVAGILGALAALLGIMGPSTIAIILVVDLLRQLHGNPRLNGLIMAVRPVVVVLLLQTAWSSSRGSFTDWRPLVIGAIAAVLIFGLRVSTPLVILGAMIVGVLFLKSPAS